MPCVNTTELDERNLEIFNAVCEHFNNFNVMTNEDFNDICDSVSKELYEVDK